ncbi:hypothetical protein M569_08752 [Genlisea aurea]|uniref:GOLD domain-containing protein n=1 Tax=Genlisea aurea TaxID=192259 RepID=S8E164_9LAMI|nr:hypothetical protein M569_08752 [Genlisea aurea]
MLLSSARAVWIELPSSGSKCVSEELKDKVVVLGDYYSFYTDISDVNNTGFPTMSVKIVSPFGKTVHQEEKASRGQFAFTATESGSYEACFSPSGGNLIGRNVTLGVEWKTGIAAQDWESVAKKDKIDGLELELQKLEAGVRTIHGNIMNMVNRESEMRFNSEVTNSRVAFFSITSLGVCIVTSILQLWYLKTYFRKKKLI